MSSYQQFDTASQYSEYSQFNIPRRDSLAHQIKEKLNKPTTLFGSEDSQPLRKRHVDDRKTTLLGSEEYYDIRPRFKDNPKTTLFGSEDGQFKVIRQRDQKHYNSSVFNPESPKIKYKNVKDQQSRAFEFVNDPLHFQPSQINQSNQEQTFLQLEDDRKVMNRHNKDFAAYEHEQNRVKRQQKLNRKQEEADLKKELLLEYRMGMAQASKNPIQLQKLKEKYLDNMPQNANISAIQIRNPLTQKLYDQEEDTIENEQVTDYMMPSKQRPPDSYLDYIEKQRKRENHMQSKLRNEDSALKLLRQCENDQDLMASKKQTEFSRKMREVSEDREIFQGKKRIEQEINLQEHDPMIKKRRVPDYDSKYNGPMDAKSEVQYKQRQQPFSQLESKNSPLHFQKVKDLQSQIEKHKHEKKQNYDMKPIERNPQEMKPQLQYKNHQENDPMMNRRVVSKADQFNQYINDDALSYYSGKQSIKAPSNYSSQQSQSVNYNYDKHRLPGYTNLTKERYTDDSQLPRSVKQLKEIVNPRH